MNTTTHDEELVDVADLLLEIATSLMGAGAHTARIVHNSDRMAKSFGYEVHFTIFQKTMTVMVRPTKHIALNFRIVSELSTLSWDAPYKLYNGSFGGTHPRGHIAHDKRLYSHCEHHDRVSDYTPYSWI